MRWLALAVLGACSFNPGQLTGDASTQTDDSGPADAASGMDAMQVSIDAPVDGPRPAAKVRSIDVVDAQVVGGPHTDFPMLVSLTAPWLKSANNGGDVLRDDGFDLYFASDFLGVTRLAFEVESYNAAQGTLVAWVKVPALSAQSVVYLHYGNPAITTSQQNRAMVWSNGYALVLHMDGTGDATGKNPATNSNAITAASGKIASAREFDGSSSYVNLGSAAAIDDVFNGGGTFEAWIKPDSFGGGGFGRIFDKGEAALFVDDENTTSSVSFYQYCNGTNSCAGQWHFSSNTITVGAWNHVVITFNSASVQNDPAAIINGTSRMTTQDRDPSGVFYSDASYNLILGNNNAGSRAFDGVLDEIRMSTVVRSAGWVQTGYRNQSDPAGFYTVSAEL